LFLKLLKPNDTMASEEELLKLLSIYNEGGIAAYSDE
jgi:hypothetical protein